MTSQSDVAHDCVGHTVLAVLGVLEDVGGGGSLVDQTAVVHPLLVRDGGGRDVVDHVGLPPLEYLGALPPPAVAVQCWVPPGPTLASPDLLVPPVGALAVVCGEVLELVESGGQLQPGNSGHGIKPQQGN